MHEDLLEKLCDRLLRGPVIHSSELPGVREENVKSGTVCEEAEAQQEGGSLC